MSEQEVFDRLKYRVEVDEDGTRMYYNGAGQRHRTDGPAAIWWKGHKEWWQNGQLHRTDGPAVVSLGGYKAWYINGKCLSEDEYNQAVKLL